MLDFNSDGTRLLSGGDTSDARVILWDTSSDDVNEWAKIDLAEDSQHSSGVTSVQFSPDDSIFLSSSKDAFIYVWDAASGERIKILEGHTAAVRNAFFTPDGTQIVSYGEDKTIRVWDIDTAVPVYQISVNPVIESAALTPDASAMLTGGPDTIVRLWDVTPLSLDELVTWTRDNRYVPELTCRQRTQYRLTPCDASESAGAG